MPGIPLDKVLANTAVEIERMAEKAAELDGLVAEMVLQSGPLTREGAEALQDVDRLRQSLECMVFLVRNLAAGAGGSCEVEAEAAAEGIYLRDFKETCMGA